MVAEWGCAVGIGTGVAAFGLGCVSWTGIEYTFHRFLGHVWPDNPFGREHLRHHREAGYFAPAAVKARVALFTIAAITGVGWPAVGPSLAFTYSAGIVTAYLGYEWFHRQIHVSPPRTAWGRWARRNHLAHHHRDPRVNHGVTVGLWDRVFGTEVPTEVVRIPRAKAPAWLLTDGSEPWRADYELVGRG